MKSNYLFLVSYQILKFTSRPTSKLSTKKCDL